eukprot:7643863-Karenia_brevis.AAC.1
MFLRRFFYVSSVGPGPWPGPGGAIALPVESGPGEGKSGFRADSGSGEGKSGFGGEKCRYQYRTMMTVSYTHLRAHETLSDL